MEFDYLAESRRARALSSWQWLIFSQSSKVQRPGLLLINAQRLGQTLISTGWCRQSRNECTAMVELNAFFIICELGREKGFQDLNKGERFFTAALSLTGEQRSGMKATLQGPALWERDEPGCFQTLGMGLRVMLMPSAGWSQHLLTWLLCKFCLSPRNTKGVWGRVFHTDPLQVGPVCKACRIKPPAPQKGDMLVTIPEAAVPHLQVHRSIAMPGYSSSHECYPLPLVAQMDSHPCSQTRPAPDFGLVTCDSPKALTS